MRMARLHGAIGAATAPGPTRRRETPVSFSIPLPPPRRCNSIDVPTQSQVLNANDRKTAELIRLTSMITVFSRRRRKKWHLHRNCPGRFRAHAHAYPGFYPQGCARDLRECLLIQLRRDGKGSSLEYKIISEHMQDLGKRRFPRNRAPQVSAWSRYRNAPITLHNWSRGRARFLPRLRKLCRT